MKYYSVSDVAEIYNSSKRRIQQMCKEGLFPGAEIIKNSWNIPEESLHIVRKGIVERKPLPIGITNYKEAVTNYYYVDKTLFIKEFLDSMPKVLLFTRPRRFGKTLMMDMLKTFFEKTNEDTSIYFKGKDIWELDDKYKTYQGKYPVIFLSLKDVKHNTWEESLVNISSVIANEFKRHKEVLNSDKCDEQDKKLFNKIVDIIATKEELMRSLSLLSKMLDECYGIAPIIIIDEYDTAIQQGYLKGYYEDIVLFIRNLFSGALKDNDHLSFAFLTGVLKVAKESILSGMNNIKICSILENKYSSYFGFTKNETKELLEYYNMSNKFQEVCEWYDGYKFGNTEIFNPWSLLNYVDDKTGPKLYWVSTDNSDIISNILDFSSREVFENLKKLLNGESILVNVDNDLVYPDINKGNANIYSFLLASGYLKIQSIPSVDWGGLCYVSIPNKEISKVYEKEILLKYNYLYSSSLTIVIKDALIKNDKSRLKQSIEQFLMETISYNDGCNECFYHGLILGICAVMSNIYYVTSNRESGLGRYDICLMPRSFNYPGIIIEVKSKLNEDTNLVELAKKAKEQIDKKQYYYDMTTKGIKDIIKIGIAFSGKNVEIA